MAENKSHNLKTWPEYFEAILTGKKTFEIRRCDDRNFEVGDLLRLEEWNPELRAYSGRRLYAIVTYIVKGLFGLPDNLCVMQLSILKY